MTVEYRRLGTVGPVVSRIGFGGELLGGTDWGDVDVQTAVEAVHAAVDAGITYFDTADAYGLGLSERRLAGALRHDRQRMVIGTKGGICWKPPLAGRRAETYLDCGPATMTRTVEESRRRLRLDCIPLYFVHWPDGMTSVERTMEALAALQRSGKIAHIGLSNFSDDQIRRAHSVAPLAAVQVRYSLVTPNSAKAVIDCCRELGIGVLAYSPLAKGFLSGKYRPGHEFPANDRRLGLELFRQTAPAAVVDRVRAVAHRLGHTPSQVALRWILDNPDIDAVVVGARAPQQVRENAAAAGWRLEAEHYAWLADAPHQAA